MKYILHYCALFFMTIFILDIFLSLLLEKEIHVLMENKIEIIPWKKSTKQIDWAEVSDHDSIPFWDFEYRWPSQNIGTQKQKSCRILGMWDSIIWWSWVSWKETYLYYLWKSLENTEVVNLWIPWSDLLQQMIKYNKEWMNKENDLLIWHLWEDDGHVYKNINGVLYDSRIELNSIWKLFLFDFLSEKWNDFLIKYSYLYNQLLLIKYKNTLKKQQVNTLDYVLDEFDKFLENEKVNNKKILLIFSPALENNTYRKDHWKFNGYPKIYQDIQERVKQRPYIEVLFLDSFFQNEDVEDIRYDKYCHFNQKWHRIIAEKLYEYIKTNELLDEKCY